MGRWIFRILIVVAVVGCFLGAIVAAGWWSLDQVRGRPRYLIAVDAIEVAPPPGLTRQEFLEQVQFAANLPDRVGLLDDDLGQRLAHAFGLHPWVESIEGVQIQPPGRVTVRLHYRRPVLAVPTESGVRVVDAYGILLPQTAPTYDLPVYNGTASPPPRVAGSKWPDPGVVMQAKLFGRSR